MAEYVSGREFLERIFRDCAGSNIELRAIETIKGSPSRVVHQKAYRDIDALLADAGKLSGRYNVFFNTAALNGGFTEEHAVGVSALRIDVDFKTGITEAEARELLAAFPLPPSAIVRTGGGLHVYWFLAEPSGREEFARVKAIIKSLAFTFRADMGACDIPRVLRLPNTINHKPDYIPPRPVTLAREDWHPDREYCLSDFAELLPIEGEIKTPPPGKMATKSERLLPIERLDAVFENCAELDGLRRNAIEAGRLLPEDRSGEHSTRIRVMNLYRIFEGGPERALQEIFSRLEDYDSQETAKQLASLNGAPPRCADLCPGGRCDAIKARGKSSPIAFAYPVRPAVEPVKDPPAVSTDPVPAEVPDIERFSLSDAGNAELIAARFGQDLRRDHAQKRWLYFSGHRWIPDNDGAPVRLDLETARARYHSAAKATGDRQQIARWALRSESRERIAAALSIAESLPPIADKGAGWDTSPFLLGGQNGVWDLRTGEVRPGRREDRITMTVGAVCNPAAVAPRWRTFLEEVFQGDEDLIRFIQRAVGYTVCGTLAEEVFFLLHGFGANGKSKFLSALRSALGDYAGETSFLTFEAAKRKSGEATPDLAELPGKRLVTASEGTDGVRWDERRVKVLTGRDPVKARDLYKSNVTFTPSCVFWLSSNHKPKVTDETESFWRRILLIPFNRFFGPGERDPNLEEKLLAEKEGVLAWIVEGALAWQREGLNPPAAVRGATNEYRKEEDSLADFLEERCILAPHLKTPTGDLFAAYEEWVKHSGDNQLTKKAFSQRLTAKGITDDRTGKKRIRLGIGLRCDR